jgi:hypothetical protein
LVLLTRLKRLRHESALLLLNVAEARKRVIRLSKFKTASGTELLGAKEQKHDLSQVRGPFSAKPAGFGFHSAIFL